jgi:hypothetical protein
MQEEIEQCCYELRAERRTEQQREVSDQLAKVSDVIKEIDEDTFELNFYNYMNVVYLKEAKTR